jgi:hypothetical protein
MPYVWDPLVGRSRLAGALATGALLALAACSPDDLTAPRPRPVPTVETVAAPTDGVAADGLGIFNPLPRLAYAWSQEESWPGPWTPFPSLRYSSSGGAITFQRFNTGTYRVDFEYLGRLGVTPSNPYGTGTESVIATAYTQGAPGVVCNATSWFTWTDRNRLSAYVECMNTATNQLVDSRFNILVVGDGALPGRSAFAIGDKPAAAQYVADPRWSFTSGTGVIAVTNAPPIGSWDWRTGNGSPAGTTFLVNAHYNFAGPVKELCKVGEFRSLGPNVRCFDADGQAHDVQHQVLQLERGRPGKRFGFAFADQPTRTTPYAAHPAWSYSSSGGAIQVSRGALGVYAVRFRGLQGQIYGPQTNAQVTAYGPTPTTCNLHSWYDESTATIPGILVQVRCTDQNGQPADSRFSVVVIE